MTQSNQGLSVRELMESGATPGLKRRPMSGAGDPMAEALTTRQRILASRLVDRTINEEEADGVEAENRRLKAEIEKRQLEEQVKQAGGQNDWTNYILQRLDATEAQLNEARREQQARNEQALMERLQMLQQEMERLKTESKPGIETIPRGELVRQEIKSARELVALITPEGRLEPLGPDEATLKAWFYRLDLDQKRWEMERADRQRREDAELQQARELKEQELDIQRARIQQADRFLNETVPKIWTLGQQLMDNLFARNGAAAPTVRPQTISPAPGVESLSCAGCHRVLYYRSEHPFVICPDCGSEYGQMAPEMVEGEAASEGTGEQ